MADYPAKRSRFLKNKGAEHRNLLDKDLEYLYRLSQDQQKLNSEFQTALTFANSSVSLYVDPTSGDDNNSGELAKPLKTIQAAVDKVPANLQGYTYFIRLKKDEVHESTTGVEIKGKQNGLVFFNNYGSGATPKWVMANPSSASSSPFVTYGIEIFSSNVRMSGLRLLATYNNQTIMYLSVSGNLHAQSCLFGQSGNETGTYIMDNFGLQVQFYNCGDDTTKTNYRFLPDNSPPVMISYPGTNTFSASDDLGYGYPFVTIRGSEQAIYAGSMTNLRAEVLSTATNCTISNLDNIILGDASGGDLRIDLPSAANAQGKIYTFKKNDASANYVIVNPSGAETIEGNSTASIKAVDESLRFISDGSSWHFLSNRTINNLDVSRLVVTNISAVNATISNISLNSISTNGTITGATLELTQAYSGTGPAAKNTLYANNMIKGWVNFAGASGAINTGFNVTSVTRHAAGDYTVNWARTFVNNEYAIAGWAGGNSSQGLVSGNSPAVDSIRIKVTEAGALFDATVVTLIAVGEQ